MLTLTGPAEAGKSTLLKNFQLLFAPKAFQAEADVWRAVVHLDVVRAVNFVLAAISNPPPTSLNVVGRGQSQPSGRVPADHLRALRMRLSPLRQVELILHKRICGDSPVSSPTISSSLDPPGRPSSRAPETSIRARPGWKALSEIKRPTSPVQDDLQGSRQIIDACKEDIVALWNDPTVQSLMRDRTVALTDYHA